MAKKRSKQLAFAEIGRRGKPKTARVVRKKRKSALPRQSKATVLPAMTSLKSKWIGRINAAWGVAQKSALGGIFETGRLLKDAKAELEHGEWTEMFNGKLKEHLQFSLKTAQALMRIERDERISKGSYSHLLPSNWTTLQKLTRLDDAQFSHFVSDGTIRPDLGQNEISKILRIGRVKADEKRILDLRPIAGKFRTIVLDPAWEYDWLSIAGRAKPGYAMQTHEQLLALDVRAWADEETGCQLYVWVTNNFMAQACELVKHWGFQHRTVITWIKPPPFGLGSYFRNSTENVLFATLGKTTTRPAAASIPTHFEAPRGEHSEKPERFYEIVRASSYPPYGEGNQRMARLDFTNLYCPVTEGEAPPPALAAE